MALFLSRDLDSNPVSASTVLKHNATGSRKGENNSQGSVVNFALGHYGTFLFVALVGVSKPANGSVLPNRPLPPSF